MLYNPTTLPERATKPAPLLNWSFGGGGRRRRSQRHSYLPSAKIQRTFRFEAEWYVKFYLLKLPILGDLFLRRKIPQMKDSYRLAVIAEDQAERPRSVVCQVLIKVERSPSEIVIQGRHYKSCPNN